MSRARPTAKRQKPLSQSRMFELIRAPLVTEKSTMGSQYNQLSFRVPLDATKGEIKAAIEGVFKVKVDAVNTLRQIGKRKRFRGRIGRRPDVKKAIVTLAEGHSIDVTTGV
jgi:large subunit ribosomal protein L23